MRKKILHHFNYYLLLIAIFGLGLIACIFAYPNRALQIFIICVTILFYILWGILHHKWSHQLTTKILVEYILIGILGISVVFFVFMGGVGL